MYMYHSSLSISYTPRFNIITQNHNFHHCNPHWFDLLLLIFWIEKEKNRWVIKAPLCIFWSWEMKAQIYIVSGLIRSWNFIYETRQLTLWNCDKYSCDQECLVTRVDGRIGEDRRGRVEDRAVEILRCFPPHFRCFMLGRLPLLVSFSHAYTVKENGET